MSDQQSACPVSLSAASLRRASAALFFARRVDGAMLAPQRDSLFRAARGRRHVLAPQRDSWHRKPASPSADVARDLGNLRCLHLNFGICEADASMPTRSGRGRRACGQQNSRSREQKREMRSRRVRKRCKMQRLASRASTSVSLDELPPASSCRDSRSCLRSPAAPRSRTRCAWRSP